MEEYKELDLYDILQASRSDSEVQIKKAYRRIAIKTHPDKASSDEERERFTQEFQKVAFAYSILSDAKRRKRYDVTGSVENIDLDDANFQDLFSQMCKTEITQEMIEQDKKEYREGGEERADILKYYKEGKGDIDYIFENVLHSDVLVDEERFTNIIRQAIVDKEVKEYGKFAKESKHTKSKRRRAAEKEAEEAEQMAKELKVKVPSGEADLALMIKARHESRFNSLIDNLEKKYAGAEKKKTSGKRSAKKAKKA